MSYLEDEGNICGLFRLLLTYFTPAMISIGMFCNVLNVLVFMGTHLRERSSSFYLAALAISDTSFLISIALIWWNDTYDQGIWGADGLCQGTLYLSVASGFFSVWLTVAFTVERFVAIRFPLHRKHVCTVSKAKMIVLGLFIFSLLYNSYTLYSAGVYIPGKGYACIMKPNMREFLKVMLIIDSVMSLALPLVLIAIMNTMIVRSLILSRRQLIRLEHSSSHQEASKIDMSFSLLLTIPKFKLKTIIRQQVPIELQQSDSSTETNANVVQKTDKGNYNKDDGKQESNMQSTHRNASFKIVNNSITKMMLLVSITFLILNTPTYIIRLFLVFSNSMEEPSANLECVKRLGYLLYNTNFCINFLLYTLCGAAFRDCLLQMLRKLWRSFVKVFQ